MARLRSLNKKTLVDELDHWQLQQNKERASINWMLNVDKARTKLNRAYEKLTGQN